MLRLWRAILENEQLEQAAKKECEMFKCTCGAEIKDSEWGWHRVNCNGFINKEQKMTREEAIKKVQSNLYDPSLDEMGTAKTKPRAAELVAAIEALGLLKFEEGKKEIKLVFEVTNNYFKRPTAQLYSMAELANKYGFVRLEEWSEGLVLWVGGEIVYKSWEKVYRKGDTSRNRRSL